MSRKKQSKWSPPSSVVIGGPQGDFTYSIYRQNIPTPGNLDEITITKEGSDDSYVVMRDLSGRLSCTCPVNKIRKRTCKHMLALGRAGFFREK